MSDLNLSTTPVNNKAVNQKEDQPKLQRKCFATLQPPTPQLSSTSSLSSNDSTSSLNNVDVSINFSTSHTNKSNTNLKNSASFNTLSAMSLASSIPNSKSFDTLSNMDSLKYNSSNSSTKAKKKAHRRSCSIGTSNFLLNDDEQNQSVSFERLNDASTQKKKKRRTIMFTNVSKDELQRKISATGYKYKPSCSDLSRRSVSNSNSNSEINSNSNIDEVESGRNILAQSASDSPKNEVDMDQVSRLPHFAEMQHLLNLYFGDFKGKLMDMITGLLLVANFHAPDPPQQLDLVDPLKEADLCNELHHWMRWAAAAYGTMLGCLKMRKKFGQYWTSASEWKEITKVAPKGDKQIVHEHLNLAEKDFITGCWDVSILGHIPGHFLGVDHEKKSVVLAIRGSSNHRDALTDLAAMYIPCMGGYVHSGILHAAQLLMERIQEPLFETLEKYPSYKFTVCGHSLGAGTTSLFTLLFHEKYPNIPIHGYAMACPCTMSEDLANKCKDYITTVVVGDDLVPRLSFGSMERLKRTMKAFLERCGSSNATRLLQITTWKLGLQSSAANKKLENIFRVSKEQAAQEELLESTGQTEFLYPPGTCYHFRRPGKIMPLYRASFKSFGELAISTSMFLDHMPNVYEKCFKKLCDRNRGIVNKVAKIDATPKAEVKVYRNPLLADPSKKTQFAKKFELIRNKKVPNSAPPELQQKKKGFSGTFSFGNSPDKSKSKIKKKKHTPIGSSERSSSNDEVAKVYEPSNVTNEMLALVSQLQTRLVNLEKENKKLKKSMRSQKEDYEKKIAEEKRQREEWQSATMAAQKKEQEEWQANTIAHLLSLLPSSALPNGKLEMPEQP